MSNKRIKQLIYSIAENSDESAFEELFYFYFSGLVSFSHAIIKDKHTAQEVVGDVFVKLWDNRQMLPTIQNLSHYLYVATKHASLNALQRQKKRSRTAVETLQDDFSFTFSNPENQLISRENIAAIEAIINALPPKCKMIFYLVKEEGLKHKEVSQILDISVKTIEAQMTIALKKISESLSALALSHTSFIKKQG